MNKYNLINLWSLNDTDDFEGDVRARVLAWICFHLFFIVVFVLATVFLVFVAIGFRRGDGWHSEGISGLQMTFCVLMSFFAIVTAGAAAAFSGSLIYLLSMACSKDDES